jgi:hypothetical protein
MSCTTLFCPVFVNYRDSKFSLGAHGATVAALGAGAELSLNDRQHVTECFFDSAFFKPNLLNSIEVRERLGSFFLDFPFFFAHYIIKLTHGGIP